MTYKDTQSLELRYLSISSWPHSVIMLMKVVYIRSMVHNYQSRSGVAVELMKLSANNDPDCIRSRRDFILAHLVGRHHPLS